jgi:hypothetical protein
MAGTSKISPKKIAYRWKVQIVVRLGIRLLEGGPTKRWKLNRGPRLRGSEFSSTPLDVKKHD